MGFALALCYDKIKIKNLQIGASSLRRFPDKKMELLESCGCDMRQPALLPGGEKEENSGKSRVLRRSGKGHHDMIFKKQRNFQKGVLAALLSGEEKETSSCGALESGIVMLKKQNKGTSRKRVACTTFQREKGITQKVAGVPAFWKLALPAHNTKFSSQ